MGRDYSPSDIVLVGDPSGGGDSLEQFMKAPGAATSCMDPG